MNEISEAPDEDSAGITKVLEKILKEKQKIDQQAEGDIVLSHIRIAHYLAELRRGQTHLGPATQGTGDQSPGGGPIPENRQPLAHGNRTE